MMNSALADPQRIRCMHGADPEKDGEGNLADVCWLDGIAPEQLAEMAGQHLAAQVRRAFTTVFVTPSDDGYVAESFARNGSLIRFCGHGALAAAFVVLHDHAPETDSVIFHNGQHSWHARRAPSSDSDTDIVLTYARPELSACPVPDFAERCLGSQPVAAAEIGAPTDYLILELDSAQTVQDIQPDYAAIGAATARAVIVTAAAGDKTGCVFRYFAPQYGQPEDSATGSAAVQLAAYWSPRLDAESFTARQLSPQGGWMRLSCSGDTVELAARVGYG